MNLDVIYLYNYFYSAFFHLEFSSTSFIIIMNFYFFNYFLYFKIRLFFWKQRETQLVILEKYQSFWLNFARFHL